MSKGKSNPRTKSPFAEKSESDTEFEKLSILEKKLLCHRGHQKKKRSERKNRFQKQTVIDDRNRFEVIKTR